MADFKGISEDIRYKRRALNMSQVELAEKAGISVNSIRLCEGGKVQPKIETLTKIAIALGEEPTAFLRSYPIGINGDAQTIVDVRQAALKQALLEAFDSMNLSGKKQSVSVVSDFAKVPEYKKGYTAGKVEPYPVPDFLSKEERMKRAKKEASSEPE